MVERRLGGFGTLKRLESKGRGTGMQIKLKYGITGGKMEMWLAQQKQKLWRGSPWRLTRAS